MNNKTRYIYKLWAAFLLPIGFGACMSGHDSVVMDIDPAGWDGAAVLAYANSDTISFREAALLLRYDNTARSGAYVIEAASPSGSRARDTVVVVLQTGDPTNNIMECRLPYRTDVRLAEWGEYRFTILPQETTRGVWSAGIDFKKMN